jgi:hypothetical protein
VVEAALAVEETVQDGRPFRLGLSVLALGAGPEIGTGASPSGSPLSSVKSRERAGPLIKRNESR